jgi:uncharacterized membrane protein YdjX (TVP38/TMEM64 family)
MNTCLKTALFVIWAGAVLSLAWLCWSQGASPQQLAAAVRDRLAGYGAWGPIIYIGGYAFRSLVFFPASLLTLMAGAIFGPLWGFAYTIVGENISANLSFLVGRYFGADVLGKLVAGSRWAPLLKCKFHRNGLLAVLTMRLMYLPFDLVGYSSGVCNIRQRDFAAGTLVGTLPGLATFTLLGGGVNRLDYLIWALLLAALSLGFSRLLKKRALLRPSPNG